MNCEILVLFLAALISPGLMQESDAQFSYVVEQNASIPCSKNNGPYKFITLLFSSSSITSQKVYTVDFRTGEYNEIPTQNYKKRVLFQHKNNIPSFLVLSLQPGDEGVFECRITPRRGSKISLKTMLYIIEPAKSVVVTDSSGKEAAGLAGPYNENGHIALMCEVIGGKPPPEITWYRNGNKIKPRHTKTKEKWKSVLKIGPLWRNHTRYSFHCEASNHKMAVVRSKPINLNINTLPTQLKFVSIEEPLVADRRYEIECLVEGSKPSADISWKLDRKPLSNHFDYDIDENKTVKVSTLTFTPKVTDEGKKLRCYAKNPVIQHKPLMVSRTLLIHYSPNVTLSFFPKISVDEGNPIRLDCNIKANPVPTEVSFYKGTDKLYDIDNYMEVSNRSIYISKTSRKSSGPYTCVARNEVGYGYSDPQSLKVNHEPQCKNQYNVVGASRHETVSVKCAVDSWPAVTKFHWQFNRSGEITYVNTDYTSSDYSSLIKYTPKSESDFGSLLCWARNSHGEMKIPCVYSIVKAELPDRLENCTQVNRTAETFVVACVSGRDGGLPQGFVAEVFDSSLDMHVHNSSSREPVFYMEELSPGTMYFVTLYSQNSKGHSEKIVLQVNTSFIADRLGLAVPSFKGFQVTPIIAIFIGVMGVLVVVAFITAGIMHMKSANEKEKYQKAPLQAVESEKSGSDRSGIPNKLKSPNIYNSASCDMTKEQAGQKGDSSDVDHAELDLPKTKKKKLKKEQKKKKKTTNDNKKFQDEKTIYASIDYKKTEQQARNLKTAEVDTNGKSTSNNHPPPNGKSTSNIPPPPKEQMALKLQEPKVIPKQEQTNPKSILLNKPEKPPIPFKPINLTVPPKVMVTKENQTSDEEDLNSKESAPLMQKTLESNL